jgi:hypothetical protein
MSEPTNHEADSLMLEAKKAILEEQHRRFQELQAAGMWQEAMQQLQVTLACAADLLKDSVSLLEKAVDQKKAQLPKLDSDSIPPNEDLKL